MSLRRTVSIRRFEAEWGDTSNYNASVLVEIMKKYRVVESSEEYKPAKFIYCIAHEDLNSLSMSRGPIFEAYTPHVRDKICIINHPSSEREGRQFNRGQANYPRLMNSDKGYLMPAGGRWSADRPYTMHPWTQGGTLGQYLTHLGRRGDHVSPGFVWHVTASLLEQVLGLRMGWPSNIRGQPLQHGAIDLGTVMIELTSSISPYPEIKLGLFEWSEYGPRSADRASESRAPPGTEEENPVIFGRKTMLDIRAIGIILHSLAHNRVPGSSSWRQDHNGRCSCTAVSLADVREDFTNPRSEFFWVLQQLTPTGTENLQEADLEQILSRVKLQRHSMINSVPDDSLIFDPDDWDLGREIIPDNKIARVLQTAPQGTASASAA